MNKSIANATYQILNERYGTAVADVFIDKLNTYSNGSYKYWENLNPNEQISLYNDFWRNLLKSIPNSTELRAWLCEGNSILAYLNAFEENWVNEVIITGVLSIAVAA